MTQVTLPDLLVIDAIRDPGAKFYAIVGAAISLAAALDLAMFDVFVRGTKLPDQLAADVFYQVNNDSARREMAATAARHALGETALAGEWSTIEERVRRATGDSGQRNLVGHNPVIRENSNPPLPPPRPPGMPVGQSVGVGGGLHLGRISFGSSATSPLGATMALRGIAFGGDGVAAEVAYYVMQQARNKKPRRADYQALRSYCAELNDLLDALQRLTERFP